MLVKNCFKSYLPGGTLPSSSRPPQWLSPSWTLSDLSITFFRNLSFSWHLCWQNIPSWQAAADSHWKMIAKHFSARRVPRPPTYAHWHHRNRHYSSSLWIPALFLVTLYPCGLPGFCNSHDRGKARLQKTGADQSMLREPERCREGSCAFAKDHDNGTPQQAGREPNTPGGAGDFRNRS